MVLAHHQYIMDNHSLVEGLSRYVSVGPQLLSACLNYCLPSTNVEWLSPVRRWAA